MARGALELIDRLRARADQDDGAWVSLVSARWSRPYGEHVLPPAGDLHLSFRLTVPGEAPAEFGIVARDVCEHRLVDANGGGIALIDDPRHPAIARHLARREKLHAAAPPGSDALATLGAITVAHTRTFDDWVPLDEILAPAELLETVLETSGLVGEGPDFVIRRHREVLDARGYQTSVVDVGPAARCTESGWAPRIGPLALLHFGDSSIVAARFEDESSQSVASSTAVSSARE